MYNWGLVSYIFGLRKMKFTSSLQIIITFTFILCTNINLIAQLTWSEKESENFKIIYLEENANLADYLLNSAEEALKPLEKIFDYTPSEKIILNIYDINDFGIGQATTVPQNLVRLSIAPFEAGYENTLYTERLHWLLTHELVHIVVNDQGTNIEKFFRKIFSKVPPEQNQPSSIFFSLLTNITRYSPTWYQEGIAVYLETWLNGGYGRVFSNFDEMYFRSLVLENKEIPNDLRLETIFTHNSFFLGTLYYFYGTRFISYLSIIYGSDKMIEWYKSDAGDFYSGILSQFEDVFGKSMDEAWNDFILHEKDFQNKNLQRLKSSPLTPIRHLTKETQGWVSEPNFDLESENIYFGTHKAHNLAYLQKLSLKTGKTEEIGSIPTPSMYQVSSTTFDKKLGYLFYTTNNNQFFRDVWVIDVNSKKKQLLFENYRIGYLTVTEETHELWGIEHANGYAILVYSPYPYNELFPVIKFDLGQEVNQLSVSPNGNFLAAVLHKTDGSQSLIIIDSEGLKQNNETKFDIVTDEGSPENPSWSPDNNFLFWNAYTNGVSNIYKKDLRSGVTEAVSHTLKGLFKPKYFTTDSLFVFEFTSDGFMPSIIPNKPAEYLPAINYLGQQILNKNPELANLVVKPSDSNEAINNIQNSVTYDAIANLDLNSFIPILSGFQNQKVLGLYAHLSDPMLIHDLSVEVGYSPFNENKVGPKFHFKAKYDYNNHYHFSFHQNATDFYDLFNSRKRGMIGRKITLGQTYYWLYDNPHKIKQASEIAMYNGVEFINDNLVRVSRPDFAVGQTNWNSANLRRTIGSSDYESGDMFDITLRGFADNPDSPQFAGQITAEWDNFSNWITKHNTMHFKLAGGYHYDNPNLIQARFYLGGFGNRAVEDVDVKQFRKVFRFPGIPIYSLSAEKFIKVMFENNLPPLRFSNLSWGQHFINHIDASIYTQAMITDSEEGSKWINLGIQLNFVFKHWFNLESTFSAGVAKAWWDKWTGAPLDRQLTSPDIDWNKGNNWEWFLSYKVLRN